MLGTQRECIGVTAACLMTRPEVFDEMGGFSEDFPGHYNDVDFALKLHTAGYRNVFTPHAVLYHFESVSRDPKVKKSEAKALEQRWGHLLGNDPYYNINLEPERNDWVERGGR
jgi:GT2 family glycosyltransferase